MEKKKKSSANSSPAPEGSDAVNEINLESDIEEVDTSELEKLYKNKKETASSNEDLTAQLEKAKSDYLYLRAEFDNYRKNAIKERSDLIKYGAERFIRQLLPVVDNFDLALATDITSDNFMDFKRGIEMTANEFRTLLKALNVEEIDPLGEPFDPLLHEALSSEESTKVKPGHVLKVFKKAYRLHDKLIRPAQVVVATETTSENSEDSPTEE